MKVLANDGMEKEGIEILVNSGIEVDTSSRDSFSLIKDVAEYDALTVRSATKITEEIIAAGASGKLKVVGRAGVGTDNIDVEAATKYGVLVKFAPNGNTNSTAELAFGLMLAVSRNIPQAHYQLQNGVWIKKKFKGTEMSYKTLGIIGCGRIGRRLVELTRGFEMKVIGYEEKPEFRTDKSIEYVDQERLVQEADYISIHTGGKNVVMTAEYIAMMKPTAYLINASREMNVDYNALFNALTGKRIAGAGIDVHYNEPKKDEEAFDSPFRGLDNVVLTSHLGASTYQAEVKTGIEMATVIRDYLLEGSFIGSVNAGVRLEDEQKRVYPLFIYHQDVPGAFAKIDTVLAGCGINIRENQSRQLGSNGNVVTVYMLHNQPGQDVVDALKQVDIIKRVNI